MSINYYVEGLLVADEKFEKMKKIYELCEDQDIAIPDSVIEYFDGESPEGKTGMSYDISEALTQYYTKFGEIYDVDLTKVPSKVNIIRFSVRI